MCKMAANPQEWFEAWERTHKAETEGTAEETETQTRTVVVESKTWKREETKGRHDKLECR